jgi:predicted dehydrogenase
MTKSSCGNAVNRILVVGLGSIGSRHVRIIRETYPDIDIAVLRHQNSDDKVESLGINHCFTNIQDAIDFSPDAALITNPAPMHLSAALPLAQAGAHLLVEKPISDKTDGIDQLIAVCNEKGTSLMVAYNLRFLPSIIKFRELLEQCKVGAVLSVRAEVGQYLPSWRPGTDYRNSVSAQQRLGGGVLLELSHEIDYLMWLFGPVEWVKASLLRQSSLDIDVEDTAYLQLGFNKNASGRQLVASLNMDFIRHDITRQCVAVGESGTLRWNGVVGEVELMSSNSNSWEVLFSEMSESDFTYREELENFFASIENGVPPSVTAEDGKAVLDVVEAAKLSSKNGQVVYL